jgi:hypothetical protein
MCLQCWGEPIVSFRPNNLEKCYHLEKGVNKLDNKLLDEFQHTTKELCPKWCWQATNSVDFYHN